MRILIVSGQQGESAWSFEAPAHDKRQWRCTADNFVLEAPADTTGINAFVTALLAHARPHTGSQVNMMMVDT